jgi:hypothetical protein
MKNDDTEKCFIYLITFMKKLNCSEFFELLTLVDNKGTTIRPNNNSPSRFKQKISQKDMEKVYIHTTHLR